MARIRNIKPAFFTNGDLGELPPCDRLLFIGLWTEADRDGRLVDKPNTLKARILPFDNHDVDAALTRLHNAGEIIRYGVDGQRYIWIVNFKHHQYISEREPQSLFPPCPDSVLAHIDPVPVLDESCTGLIPVPDQSHTSPTTGDNDIGQRMDEGGCRGENAAEAATTPASKSKPRKEATDPKGTRIPPDWKPGSEGWKWARDRWKDVPPEVLKEAYRRRTENFVTYWTNLPGAKARKLNWYTTWQNSLKDDEAEGRFFRRDSVVTSVSASAQNRLPTPAEVIAAETERNRLFRERNGLPQVEAGQ